MIAMTLTCNATWKLTLLNVTLLALFVTLTACGGGSGGDASAPAIPVSADLPASGAAPANTINLANAAAVSVAVVFDENSLAENTVTVELSDGTQVVSASAAASAGEGTVLVGPMDASALADGGITVRGRVANASATSAWINLGSFSKDTVAPSAPIAIAFISAVPVSSGPAIINAASATATAISVTFSEEHRPTDTAQISFSDGVTAFTGQPFNPSGEETRITLEGINLSGLADGEISAIIQIADAAGNSATWPGTTALKDTFVAVPAHASVAGSAANQAGEINAANASTVTLLANFRDDHLETDTFITRFRSGLLVATSAPQSSERGEGTYTCLPADCTAFPDGTVTFEVVVSDIYGNTATWSGGSAPKDTVAGTALAATIPAGASNPADTINAASQGAVYVDVIFDLATQSGDTVEIALNSGPSSVTFTGVSNGSPMQTFGPMDATALNDGSVGITVAVVDSHLNNSFGFVGTCGKDTQAPAAPSSVIVASGVSNDPNWINKFNVNNGVITGSTPAVVEPGRTITLRAFAGAQSFVGTFPAPLANSPVSFAGLNFSAFAEGPVALEAWCTDAAGNSSAITTGMATKDTIVAIPTTVSIASGSGHVTNSIAIANVSGTAFDFTFGASSLSGDVVSYTLTSGGQVIAPTFNAPAGAGSITRTIDCSSLTDGSVALAGSVSDDAGNVETFGAFFFVKDTVAPAAPTSVAIPATAQSPSDVVNSFTANGAQVNVNFGAASQAGESWTLGITAGTNIWSIATTAVAPNATQAYVIDMSAWADGSITFGGTVTDAVGNSTSFSGTSAYKDTVGPVAPLAATVAAGASNASNVINGSSVAAVQVDVTLDPAAGDTDTVTASFTGTNTVSSNAQSVPHGSSFASITGIDCSTLDEGSVDLRITVRDSNWNETHFAAAVILKDTIAPVAPTNLGVISTGTNPANWINASTAASTTIEGLFATSYAASDTMTLTVSGIGGNIPLGAQNVNVGGTNLWTGLDLSSFADGAVALSLVITDAQGNSATYLGTPATKDTVAPVAPQAVSLPATGTSPLGVVNSNNAANSSFAVSFTNNTENNEFFTLSMSDGANAVNAPETPCVQGGNVSVAINAATNAEGTQTLSISLRDVAGNTATYAQGTVFKDTIAPDLPINGQVMGGPGNPWHVINLNSVGSVTVTAAFGANSVATDTVSLVLNGSSSMNGGSQAAPNGPGTLTFSGLDTTSLADGPVALQFTMTDNNLNSVIFMGTLANKDTLNADPISAAHVAAGANNPIDAINSFTVNAALVQVSFPNTYAGVEWATVTLDDGVNAPLVSSAVTIPAGGGLVNFTGLNTALLNEGTLTLLVDINDGSGNTSNHFGSNAVKDTVAPNPPTNSYVNATASSPQHIINAATSTSVDVFVFWDNTANPAYRYVVTLSDGTVSVDSAVGIPVVNGSSIMTVNSASLAEGAISVSVRMLDPVGNYADAAGTPATRDVTPPAAPISLSVAASASNAAHWLNIASTPSVDVNATFGADSVATDTVVLTLADASAATVAAPSQNAPAGAGNLGWSALNCAALADGNIHLSVTITDAAMNSTTYAGTNATKDTMAPVVPTSASFTAGAANPANTVNIATVANAPCSVIWPAATVGDESYVVTVGGSLNTASAFAPANGGSVALTFDTTALADGSVSISVAVTDPAGNTSSMNGSAAIKDTVAPAAALSAAVNGSAANPVNVVNANSVGNTTVAVSFGASANVGETFVLTLSDGANSVSSSPANCVVSASTNVSFNAAALAEGALSLGITVTDSVWNSTSTGGTAALKDTIPPAAPANLAVSAGANNSANWLNIASSGTVDVGANFAASSDATDSVVLTLVDDLAGSITVASQPAPAGAGSLSWSAINCTALVDGGISLSVSITDAQMNTATYAGTSALKDTVAPTVPSSAAINAGANNPSNYVNIATASACAVELVWPGISAGDETYSVTLAGSLTSANATAPVGGGSTMTSFDASALADGAVSISVAVSDPAGNTASMNGTAATKDTVPPAAATSASISPTAQNPAHWINSTTSGAASASVSLGASSEAGDQVSVTLAQGALTVSSSAQPATGGMETLSYVGLDTTAFADGNVSVSTTVSDAAGNTTTSSGTSASRDTVAPSAPSFAGINATALNPAGYVNSASQTTVEVGMTFAATAAAGDSVTLQISDGVNPAMSYGPSGATGTVVFVNQDMSGFNDGPLTVTAVLTDLAGNSASYSGSATTKDTVAPTAPSSYRVAAGATNAQDIINIASVGTVQVSVIWDASLTGSEIATLSLSGGASLSSGNFAPPTGGGAASYSFDASTLTDGNVTLSGTLTDSAWNVSSFNGTAALKDTVAPAAPTSLSLAASTPTNPVNVVNLAGAAAVTLQASFGAFNAADSVNATITDGNTTVSAGTQGGAASVTWVGLDCSTLNDGSLSLSVSVTDSAGNAATYSTSASKDTVAPAAPSSIAVPSGVGWNSGWFAIANSAAANVRVILPSSYTGGESIELTVTDTLAASVSPAAQSASAGGGTMDFTGMNCASLADGDISLRVLATDSAMNSTTTNVTISKDCVAPVAPTSASVPVGGSNPVNTINANTATAAIAELVYGATAHGNDRATVTFSDGTNSSSSAEVLVPSGGGTVQTAAFSASALADGTITLSVACSDLAGNTNSGSGTNATKDTVAPATPVVDPVVTPTNKATQEISGAADPSTTVVISGGTAQVTTTSNVAGSWAANVGLVAASTTTLSVTTTDAAGNSSSAVLTAWNASTLAITRSATAPDVPFTDVSTTNGALTTGGAAGGGFVDIDNDGDLDLFIGGAGKLLINNGSGVFTDVTASTGALFNSDCAAVFGDYDNDGDLDLLLTHSTLGSTLWKNEWVGLGTLTFSDVNVSSGAAMGTVLRGATWFDYNKDGWLDAVVADADGLGNELIRNTGGSFIHVYGTGIEAAQGDANWVAMGDFNGDGTDDVIIGDSTPGMLFTNNGLGAFTNVAGGASGFTTNMSGSGGGVITCDVDNDGDLDIFTCRGGAGNTNQLWLNNGLGVFTEVGATAGLSGQATAFDAVFADFNNDGLPDLYLAGNGNDRLLRNDGDQVGADGIPEFTEIGSQTGSVVNDNGAGRLACAGDIDGDGDLDLYVGNNSGTHLMLQNTLGGQRCLKVRVVGKGGASGGSSKDAIGARIRVRESTSLTNLAWRTVGGGRGRGAQDPAVQFIGGLRPSWPYDVIVTFPSGISMTVTNVVPATLPGQLLTITEN